jgi:hypothetical protein
MVQEKYITIRELQGWEQELRGRWKRILIFFLLAPCLKAPPLEVIQLPAEEAAIAPGLPAVEVPPLSRIRLSPETFQKLLALTTALGDVGLPKESFGFLITAGSLVAQAENRECVMDVGGVGFAELSRELAQRLQEMGKPELPVQIVDDGAGRLRLYISPPLKGE